MSYREQIFKGLANGKYGTKPYIEMARKKTNASRSITNPTYSLEEKSNDNFVPNNNLNNSSLTVEDLLSISKINTEKNELLTSKMAIQKLQHDSNSIEINNNIQKMFLEEKNNSSNSEYSSSNDSSNCLDEDCVIINENIQNLFKNEVDKYHEENRENRETLEKKLQQIEEYLSNMVREMDRMKMIRDELLNTIKNLSK